MDIDLPLILEPEALEEKIDHPDLMIIDLCQDQTYNQLHIPGAIHITPSRLMCGIAPVPGKLPDLEQLNALFSEIGYTPDKHIVAYDDEGGGWAGRFIWTLDIIGHKHYSYLNGGLHSWHKENHQTNANAIVIEPSEVDLLLNTDPIAEVETIMASLNDPTVKVWDARSAEEYAGTKLSSKRGGHIPGAVNLDWLDTMDKTRNLRLLPLDQLSKNLAALGINPEDEIITHCQSHHRSGLTYLIAKALGHKAKGYHGSWAEWGNLPETPIES